MRNIKNPLNRIIENDLFFPTLIIIVIAAIAYLPFISQLGFYRDDWYQIWAGITQGSSTLIKMFSIDRPALGFLYVLTHKLLGSNLIYWHLFAFFTRVATSIILFWLLQLIWPEQKKPSLIMASLFIIYPGYLEQPFANTSINLFIAYGLSLFSITMSIYAYIARKMTHQIFFIILSVITGFFYLVIFEYLIGMEIVRISLFFFVEQKNKRIIKSPNRVAGIIKQLIPYLVMLLIFTIWRLFLFKNSRSTTDMGQIIGLYSSDPWNMFFRIISNSISGIYNAIIQAWAVPLYNLSLKLTEKEFVTTFFISAFSAIGFYYYLSNNPTNSIDKKWAKNAVLIGMIAVFFVALPLILVNRKINFENTFDHYTFPLIFGTVVLVVGLVYLIDLKSNVRSIIFTILFAAAIFTQFANGIHFSKFWDIQRSLWWQLSWRAPGIKNDTSIVVFTPSVYRFAEAYEIWAPINMIYNPERGPLSITAEVPNNQTIPLMIARETYGEELRRVEFVVDFKQMLVLSAPNSGVCMHAFDGRRNEISSFEEAASRLVYPFSNVDLIDTTQSPHQPPAGIFGEEPDHNWCYYYQKASLARQDGNWDEIVKLGEEVKKLGLQPKDLSEWMPFYEGFTKGSRIDLANEVGAIIRNDQTFIWQFCDQYKNVDWSKEDKMDTYFVTNICGI